MSRKYLALLILMPLILMAACVGGGSGANEAGSNTIRFGFGTSPSVNSAYYTSVPKAMGYWKDQGLDVQIVSFDGSKDLFAALSAGKVDVVATSSATLFQSVEKGQELKAYFSSGGDTNWWSAAVLKNSPITEVRDLKDKKIGVSSLSSDGVTMIKALAASEGVSPESLEFVPVGIGAHAYSFLESGKVDALALWKFPYAQLEALGHPLRIITTPSFKRIGFQHVIAAKSSALQSNRKNLVKFARGIAQAMVLSKDNPKKIVKASWEVFPETKPSGQSESESMKVGLALVKAVNDGIVEKNGQYGASSITQVRKYEEAMKEGGALKQLLPPEKVWTDGLLKEINKFSRTSITK